MHIGELARSGGVLDPLMQIGLKPNNGDSGATAVVITGGVLPCVVKWWFTHNDWADV